MQNTEDDPMKPAHLDQVLRSKVHSMISGHPTQVRNVPDFATPLLDIKGPNVVRETLAKLWSEAKLAFTKSWLKSCSDFNTDTRWPNGT